MNEVTKPTNLQKTLFKWIGISAIIFMMAMIGIMAASVWWIVDNRPPKVEGAGVAVMDTAVMIA